MITETMTKVTKTMMAIKTIKATMKMVEKTTIMSLTKTMTIVLVTKMTEKMTIAATIKNDSNRARQLNSKLFN